MRLCRVGTEEVGEPVVLEVLAGEGREESCVAAVGARHFGLIGRQGLAQPPALVVEQQGRATQ